MSHTTHLRRALSVVGAAGLIVLSMAGPAGARPDPGSGSPRDWHCSTSCYQGGGAVPVDAGVSDVRTVLRVDDTGVQVLQLGAGVLAGLAMAGAGAALVSRRHHAQVAHPA